MNKLALTNFILFAGIKFVSACELSHDEEKFLLEHHNFDYILFYSSIALIFPFIILYFLRKREGLSILIASVLSIFLFVILTFITAVSDMCGSSSSNVIRVGSALLLLLLSFQVISWIAHRRKLKVILS